MMEQEHVIKKLIYRNEVQIAPGVSEVRCAFYDSDDQKVETYIMYVNMKEYPVHIDAALPDNGDIWGMQKTTQMAKAASLKGHRVVGAVNGDFYTMTSGEPEGVFIKDCKILKESMKTGKNFFGIKKDNTPVIGDENFFNSIKYDLKTAVGGRSQLIKRCQLNHAEIDNELVHHPRTAVGILPDGTVMFVVVDGRQPGFSEGFDLPKLAKFMQALGAVEALNLDGGGSSTFAVRLPGTDELKMLNSTSDGEERTTANSILIVSGALEDQKFTNAYIEPFDIAIAPGGFVDFKGSGRDASGAAAQMPSTGLKWSISDPEYGTINENGHFISGGKEGYVEIILKYGNLITGKTGLKIVTPDQLLFGTGQEIIISKNTEKDLRLFGKLQGREVRVQSHQVNWSVPEDIGFINGTGNLCTGILNCEGKVIACLKNSSICTEIKVKVALLPVILYDFENNFNTESWSASSLTEGASCSTGEAKYPIEPVRTGDAALKLSFDFVMNEKVKLRVIKTGPISGKEKAIPDKPIALGMWVYADKKAQGLIIKGKLIDADGNVICLDYTKNSRGIDWTGWKYVEAEILTDYKAPIAFCDGEAIILESIQNENISGELYIDNIRAVYGEKDDDPYSPSVKHINVEGKTYDTDMVNIVAWMDKKTGYKYAAKINYNRIRIFVDDIEYTNLKGHYGINKGNNTVMLSGLKYSNGFHKVKVWFQDCFGNEAAREAAFNVATTMQPG